MTPGSFSLRTRIRALVFVFGVVGAIPLGLFGILRPGEGTAPDALAFTFAFGLYGVLLLLLGLLIENLVFNQLGLLGYKARTQGQGGIRDQRTPAKHLNIDRGLADLFLDEDVTTALKRRVPPLFRPIRDYSTEPIEHPLSEEAQEMLGDLRSMAWSAEGAVHSIKQDIFRHFSHQLKSPMAVVRSHVLSAREAIETDQPKDASLSSLKKIDQAAQGVVGLVDQVLSMAHIDHAGKHGFPEVSVDIHEMTTSVIAMKQTLADDRDILLVNRTTPGVHLRGEANLLRELLSIFIDNAIFYGKEGCDVEVMALRHKSHIELIVQDEGPGIPRHERQNVLNPFYGTVGTDDLGRPLYGNRRHRSLSEVSKSTHGLGLSLAASIVELHKGILLLEDRPDGKNGLRVVCKFSSPTGS